MASKQRPQAPLKKKKRQEIALPAANGEAVMKRGRGRGSIGRDAIIRSTRDLLRDVPPSSLSRKFVAEAANVDPALVRYYFSDLRSLMTEVLKLLVADYRDLYARLDLDGDGPQEIIAKRIKLLVTFLSREPSFHELFVEQIINGKDEWARATRDDFTDVFYGTLKDVIDEGRNRGLFREGFDPRFVYIAIIGAAQFLASSRTIFHRLFGEGRKPPEFSAAYAQFLTEAVLSGISTQAITGLRNEKGRPKRTALPPVSKR